MRRFLPTERQIVVARRSLLWFRCRHTNCLHREYDWQWCVVTHRSANAREVEKKSYSFLTHIHRMSNGHHTRNQWNCWLHFSNFCATNIYVSWFKVIKVLNRKLTRIVQRFPHAHRICPNNIQRVHGSGFAHCAEFNFVVFFPSLSVMNSQVFGWCTVIAVHLSAATTLAQQSCCIVLSSKYELNRQRRGKRKRIKCVSYTFRETHSILHNSMRKPPARKPIMKHRHNKN